jgi:hypothetical protein
MLHQALRDMGKPHGITASASSGIAELTAALDIEERHGTSGIVFVDGWTGKGAITGELVRALKDRPGYPEQPRLVVLADPCGCSWLAAVMMTGSFLLASWVRRYQA